jgi:uncharacterized phage protein (TIGR01671 family)
MREILFKGKRVDNGEWIEGLPYKAKYGGISSIVDNDEERHLIIPETLCEFTGLHDKNGKRIWEGDIVKGKFDGLYIILWYPRNAQFIKFSGYDRVPWTDIESMTRQNLINPLLQKDMCSDLEVIGNVIDNPKLLTAERIGENEN